MMNSDFNASIEIDWLKKWNLYSPSAIALKDGDTGAELTYKGFYELSVRAARVLKSKYDIKRGDRIAVLSTNEIEYIYLFFAAQRLGAVLVPINFRLTPREITHIVKDSDPRLVIYHSEFTNLLKEVSNDTSLNKFASLKIIPSVSNGSSDESFQSLVAATNFSECETSFRSEFDDAVMILYTSGTTGSPKGAVLTHKTLFWNSINTSLRLNLSQSDCAVIFLPLFHTGGWNVLTTPFIHRGAKIVLIKKFEADAILGLSEKEKATLLFGVPTTMDMMARHESFKSINLGSLRYAIVGGEPMPIELIKTWHQKGIPVRQGYGLTEFGPNVFSLNEEDSLRKIGSIGFANFYIDTKIVDENNQVVKPGEIGELALRGPMMMKEYWKNPKATEETIREGWLHTGDLVRQDKDGFFFVVGRKKDMYISGGENVYPPEIEQVLRTCPGVREVAVIGTQDEKWGEVGKAFVVKDNEGLTEDSIKEFCSQNLAKFKIPKYFMFMDALPKGDSGKILKKNLT